MSTETDTLDHYATLFAGRNDAHGTWTGGKADGPPNFTEHLAQGPHIGVYCVLDDNTCNWGCIDIDGKDFPIIETTTQQPHGTTTAPSYNWEKMWNIAGELQEALQYKNITSWTERTTNGIHLWTFPTQPVPAATMRRALLAACQVIKYLPKEVNPKQETLNPDKRYGNYVRLPYYGAMNIHPCDRFVIDEDGPMGWETFVNEALDTRNMPELYEAVAELYDPPPEKIVHNLGAGTKELSELWPILPPVVKLIFENGPLGGDRSGAMVKCALMLRDEGWTPQGIFWVIEAMDDKLGKFTGRADRQEQIEKIVQDYGVKQ